MIALMLLKKLILKEIKMEIYMRGLKYAGVVEAKQIELLSKGGEINIIINNMDTVEQITVIKTTLLRRGEGIKEDPVRIITQYWSLDGELLAEVDPEDAPI